MNCPKCGNTRNCVIDSRKSTCNSVRRRRFCKACGHKWTTYEITEIDKALLEMFKRRNET
jgi:transcriptional repressor NrdR